ncbi:MAG: hypothetical protein J0I20_06475 [Chloroflexi bacterium]|nr:hypothetical protein [Chloroflexota bacterium]OJV90231.1 MAG: hypothetical protein BGO39_02415 [Chloroflexi bacterium 54-19]
MATQISGQPEHLEPPPADRPAPPGPNAPMPPYNYPNAMPPQGTYYQQPQPGGYYYPGVPSRPVMRPPYPRQRHPVAIGLALFFGGVIFLTVLAGVFFSLFALNILDWPGRGPLVTETRTVALDNATQANVEIHKGIGNLIVNSGATDLMSGTYSFNNTRWRPEINYSVNGTTGNLILRQPDGPFFGSFHYDWDLRFKSGTPLDFRFDLGVGNANLNLSGLTLTGLNIQAGVGNTDINLAGITTTTLNGNINGGVGSITIRVPQDIGVQLVINQGLGQIHVNGLRANGNTYTNDAFGKTANSIRLNISSGVGEITINQ